MDWKEIYERRLTTPEEAVKQIRSGDLVAIPIFPPQTLQPALYARHDELRDVKLRFIAPSSDPGWFKSGNDQSFQPQFELYVGDFARFVMDERRGDYVPNLFSLGFKHYDERPGESPRADAVIVSVSPPNKHGYVHFGGHHWFKRAYVRRVRTAIAEVDPSLITVHGDVYAHVSEFSAFVEYAPPTLTPEDFEKLIATMDEMRQREYHKIGQEINVQRLAPFVGVLGAVHPDDVRRILGLAEPPEYARAMAGYVESLIPDGATIQVGTGEPGRLMPNLGVFDNKHDLGLHTELGSPGYGRLVRDGVITGKYKSIHRGKAVATAWTGCDDKDFEIIDDNPLFELYDPDYVLNMRTLLQLDNYVTINNGIQVDLLGQANSESVFGGRMINGTGGQPEMMLAGTLSRGGKSILLLPSTALNGSVSRIVPQLEKGSLVTVPRFFVDYVVTEHGIARLLGKSHRERANELIAIAHPDFRAELRREAEKLWWP